MAKSKSEFVASIVLFFVLAESGKLLRQSQTEGEINPHDVPEGQTAYRVTFGGYEGKPPALWVARGWSNKDGSKQGFKSVTGLPLAHVQTVTEIQRRICTAGQAKTAAA